ncbi:DUF58 domain-containing protein [Thalassotalea sp. LPB0316]|uniref:DUF58 domain-containing protein n=1 Tax=Thalassotalea sp. LPB0316 TaxID=2769490 RepID=UPI00186757B5|nr:DUF58 domain-containing protein [Thalassotalea sp. LPB0316]QOL25386.1 DUF58 domain-containing protein [Thalassotalea sp. LPB0316]
MLKGYLQERMLKWLKQRIPPARQHVLSSQNIFIFPSVFGFAYLFMVLVIFLLGTNYQNNIILMFSFLLASLFVTTMLISFQNLNKLALSIKNSPQGFAHQLSYLKLEIKSAKSHYFLRFAVEPVTSDTPWLMIEQLNNEQQNCNVPLVHESRGVKSLGRLRIESSFPLGLFTTWTRLDLASELITFPQPKQPSHLTHLYNNQAAQDGGNFSNSQRGEDFYQLENYQPGQPLSQVAWKQLAKSQQWLSKGHTGQVSHDIWFDYQHMPSALIEDKYSEMTALILEYSKLQQPFGIKLVNQTIAPEVGEHHQLTCLLALAKA